MAHGTEDAAIVPQVAPGIVARRNCHMFCHGQNRNVIERAFNQLKNWRGIGTRYDKHALVYRGGIVLAAITLWLRA